MLPIINGHSFLECSIEELQSILDNQDYRESEYLDYKKEFELATIPKDEKTAISKAKAEFRKDVCALANAQGGYLIYGIKEDGKGVPHELSGIVVTDNNPEVFENAVRNTLQTIEPKIPHFEIKFVVHGEKYIVILYIHHDFFSPYIFLENNQDYRIYKRVGNSVSVSTYAEIRTMFTQSVNLEKEIESFRKARIAYYLDSSHHPNRFLLLHIIPETFLDSSYNKPIYYLDRKGNNFRQLFYGFECDSIAIPTVEGIKCYGRGIAAESRLYNNGIAECLYPIDPRFEELNRLPWSLFWEKNISVLQSYFKKLPGILETNRFLVGISFIGCNGFVSETDGWNDITTIIDQDILLCEPVWVNKANDPAALEKSIKRVQLSFLLSLGIRMDSALKELLSEVYE